MGDAPQIDTILAIRIELRLAKVLIANLVANRGASPKIKDLIVLLIVGAEQAFGGLPFLALAFYEFVNAFVADEFQVFDLAHAIFCLVSFI